MAVEGSRALESTTASSTVYVTSQLGSGMTSGAGRTTAPAATSQWNVQVQRRHPDVEEDQRIERNRLPPLREALSLSN